MKKEIHTKGSKHMMKKVGQGQILQGLEYQDKGIPTFLVYTK